MLLNEQHEKNPINIFLFASITSSPVLWHPSFLYPHQVPCPTSPLSLYSSCYIRTSSLSQAIHHLPLMDNDVVTFDITEEHVLIEWNEEPGHCSTIPLVFLLSNDYSDEARQSRREDRVPSTAKVRSKC